MLTGFDAYKQVLATDCDLVILATPPGFRAEQLMAAVNAGKHVFTEKPVAVDVKTALAAIAAADIVQAKGLGIVAGTQRRHDPRYRERFTASTTARSVRWSAVRCAVNGGLWSNVRKPR